MIIYLGRLLPDGSCGLPGASARGQGGEQPPACFVQELLLFGLAPGGGYLAVVLLLTPVVSYTTFSPLPNGRSVSVALSGAFLLTEGFSPRVLPGTMFCGVRTFLDPVITGPRSPDQPEVFSSYPFQ